MRRLYLFVFLAGSAAIPAAFVACSGGGTSPAGGSDAASPGPDGTASSPDATGGDATTGDATSGPAMEVDGGTDAPLLAADGSAPDSSPSETDAGLDAGPPPGDALASMTACPPLATPIAELDASACGTVKVLYDAGALCNVPCSSVAEGLPGTCAIPCTAGACCSGDYALPDELSIGWICGRYGVAVPSEDGGCGSVQCSACGGYTCPAGSLCSADCFCNANNEQVVTSSGGLLPDPFCFGTPPEDAGNDAGCGTLSGSSGSGGCTRCRL